MYTIIINEPKCPKCGCKDLREHHWGWQCFKCDHYMPRGQVEFVKYDDSELGVDDHTPRMINIYPFQPFDNIPHPLVKNRKD